MIEAWGRGIRRIVDICAEIGNPVPTWRLDAGGDGLWVRFPFSESYQVADAAARGNTAGSIPPDTTQKRRTTTQMPTGTTRKPTRDRIVDCLRAEPGLTRAALAARVGLTPDGVK